MRVSMRARVWARGRTRGRQVGRLRSAGMTTAEYAVGTLAAVAFAAVLLAVVKSGAVVSALTSIITTALGSAG